MSLAIFTAVAGEEWNTLDPPADFGSRDWILGVVAVQVFFTPGDGLSARVRAHRTGMAEARERALGNCDPVTIVLREPGAPAPGRTGRVRTSTIDGAPGFLAYLGPALYDRAEVPQGAGIPLRAFGHVFARWRRDGSAETGVDITSFAPAGSGEMAARLRSSSLAPNVTVTFQVEGMRVFP